MKHPVANVGLEFLAVNAANPDLWQLLLDIRLLASFIFVLGSEQEKVLPVIINSLICAIQSVALLGIAERMVHVDEPNIAIQNLRSIFGYDFILKNVIVDVSETMKFLLGVAAQNAKHLYYRKNHQKVFQIKNI